MKSQSFFVRKESAAGFFSRGNKGGGGGDAPVTSPTHSASDGTPKVVLIIGASSGIGKACSQKLLKLKEPPIVCCTSRDPSKIEDLKDMGASTYQLDVTDDTSVDSVVTKILGDQSKIDVLVYCVGSVSYGLLETISSESVTNEFDVNVVGAFRCARAVLPSMRSSKAGGVPQGGRLVFVTAAAANLSVAGTGVFAASKAALASMTVALRQEVREFGIDVVQVEPGHVKGTDFEKTVIDGLGRAEIPEEYAAMHTGLSKITSESFAKAPDANSTSDVMMSAIFEKKVKHVYKTATDSRLLAMAYSWGPKSAVDSMVIRDYKKAGKPKEATPTTTTGVKDDKKKNRRKSTPVKSQTSKTDVDNDNAPVVSDGTTKTDDDGGSSTAAAATSPDNSEGGQEAPATADMGLSGDGGKSEPVVAACESSTTSTSLSGSPAKATESLAANGSETTVDAA